MANELCAYGFGSAIDGTYQLMYQDHWTNGTYWIYKDSFWWMISTSEFLYDTDHLVCIKTYVAGSWANGTYYSVGPWEDGNYTLGTLMGYVRLGEC